MNSWITEKMHLQWFADPLDESEFEDPEEEIVFLNPGETPPEPEPEVDEEKERLKEEIEALRRQAAQGDRIENGLSQLGQALNKPQEVPSPEPGESEEDFAKRMEQDFFKPGMTSKIFQEALRRYAGPALTQIMGNTAAQSKQILMVDPEKGSVFRQYEKEIEEERKRLPQNEQYDPLVYHKLLDRIMARPDMQEKRIEEKAKEMAEKILKEHGLAMKREPTYTESGGSRGQQPTKKKKYVTEQMRQEALRKGIDPERMLEE
jgi:cell division septum initiation protein DivIVA